MLARTASMRLCPDLWQCRLGGRLLRVNGCYPRSLGQYVVREGDSVILQVLYNVLNGGHGEGREETFARRW